MMKLDGLFCRLMSVLMCAVMLAVGIGLMLSMWGGIPS